MDHVKEHVSYIVRIKLSYHSCVEYGFADFKKAYYKYLTMFDKYDNVELIKRIQTIYEIESEITIK